MIKKCYKRSKFNPWIKVLSLLYLQEQKLLHYILGHISILLYFNYFIFSDDWCKGKQCLQRFHHAGQYSVCGKCKYPVVFRKKCQHERISIPILTAQKYWGELRHILEKEH